MATNVVCVWSEGGTGRATDANSFTGAPAANRFTGAPSANRFTGAPSASGCKAPSPPPPQGEGKLGFDVPLPVCGGDFLKF